MLIPLVKAVISATHHIAFHHVVLTINGRRDAHKDLIASKLEDMYLSG